MNKFRASYSVLDTWHKGQWEKAVKMYFKLDGFMTEAMAEGKDFHESWSDEIQRTGNLPVVFGGQKLNNPIPERKMVIQLEDWIELVGIPDCLDAPIIHEFKTGVSESDVYARGWQGKVYQVLCYKYKPTQFHIHHYNQHTGHVDMSIIHLTEHTFREGVDWIITVGSEMHNYLLENGLYDHYGRNRKHSNSGN